MQAGAALAFPRRSRSSRPAACTGVVVEIPASDHMIKNAYGWTVDRAMKSSIDTTLAAKEAGLYTVFFTIDATRTEVNRFLDIVDQVATEGHMDALTMADTVGGVHARSDLHVGEEGDRTAEEAGGDPLPPGFRPRRRRTRSPRWQPAPPWRTRRSPAWASAPATCRWKTSSCRCSACTASTSASRRRSSARCRGSCMDLAKVTQPPNRPIVGDKLYEVESGIIAGWIRMARKENPLEYVPFAAELVGQKPVNIVLGKNSGPPSIEEWCEKLGINGHATRSDGDAAAGEGQVVREEGSADRRRVQGDSSRRR